MKRYSRPDSQHHEESAAKVLAFHERQILTPKTPIQPIILQHEAESDNSAKQDGKFSMEDLCKVFIERIGHKLDCQFQAKELVQATGVKQRRIYDLMNILEGCGFMKRISKGTYMWYGFEENPVQKSPKEGRKKQATSLSFLAARVKYLLFNAPTYIDFKDICQQILEENSNNSFNPDSIKRRVYQCCKILKVVGLIDKRQHTFKWITKEDREKTQGKAENMKMESFPQNEVETLKKNKDQQEHRQYLISQLIKEVHNEQQLKGLLQTISNQFNKKKMMQGHPYPRRLFGDS